MDSNFTQILEFQNFIFDWWKINKRQFPWRETTSPYQILVSEIMLQQTQAMRVIPKYNEFITKFPTLESLAKVSNAVVLGYWSGLGYNRRAIYLRDVAIQLLESKDPSVLKKLKGVGEYTSRSILIFAFNKNIATVDVNIRRIIIHKNFATADTTEKELYKTAEKLLPSGRSKDWHNALMDYGAIEATAKYTGIPSKSKQSKFEGSDRQIRGKIVKILLKDPNSEKSIFENLNNTAEINIEHLRTILSKMISQKIIKIEKGKFTV